MERLGIHGESLLVLWVVVRLHHMASLDVLTHYVLSVEIPSLPCVSLYHQIVQL